jgi:hypothetical protein
LLWWYVFLFMDFSPPKCWVDLFIFSFISVSWINVLDDYWLGLEVRPCIGRKGKMSWFMVAIQIPSPLPRVSMTHERGVGDPIWAGEVVIPHVYYQGLGIFWVGKSLSHALPYC